MATAAWTHRLLMLAAVLAAATTAVLVGGAKGGAAATLGCPGASEHPYLPWLDPLPYTLAPGGTFEESTTSWNLANGAKLVSGNESFKVHKSTDGTSLALPAGATATTPAFCVGLAYPTVRFFAVGGNLTSALKVDVIYRTALGSVTQPVTYVPARGTWQPTLPALLLANVIGVTSLDGLTSSVQLRFTALGNAAWRIDDVYVDPWKVT